MTFYGKAGNQAVQILPAILTIGTERTPERGAVDKIRRTLFTLLVQVLLWVADTRKVQGTQGRRGERSVTMWRRFQKGNKEILCRTLPPGGLSWDRFIKIKTKISCEVYLLMMRI